MEANEDILNRPDVAAAIKDGTITAEDVTGQPATPPPTPTPAKNFLQMKITQATPEVEAQDKIIGEAVTSGAIPNRPDVIAAIKDGTFTLDEMKAALSQQNKDLSSKVITDKGITDKPKVVEQVAAQQLEDPNTGTRASIMDSMGRTFKKQMEHQAYYAGQALEGFTMGMVASPIDKPDADTAFESSLLDIYGTVINIGGGIASGVLGGMALRGAPLIGKAFQAIDKAAGAASGAKAFAIKSAEIALEAAPQGAVAGAVKSAIRGEDMSDILASGAIEGTEYALGGMVLHGAVTGAGKLFARRKVGRANALNKFAETEGRPLAEAYTAAEEGASSTLDQTLAELAAKPLDELTQDETKLLSGLVRIKATQPVAGVTEADVLVKDPETLRGLLQKDLKAKAEYLYTSGDAPLKLSYEKNPTIKAMMDGGDYVGAVQAGVTSLHKLVGETKTVKELLVQPFMQDAESLYKVMANRVIKRMPDDPEFSGATQSLIVNYFKNPSAENLQAIKEVVPADRSRIFGKEIKMSGEPKIMDLRIPANEADQIVGNIMESYFSTLSNGGRINFKDIGKIQDTDSILKAAVTMNKEIQTTSIDGARRAMDFGSYMIRTKPEMQDPLVAEMNLRRVFSEKSHRVGQISGIKDQIAAVDRKIRAALPEELPALKGQLADLRKQKLELSREVRSLNQSAMESELKLSTVDPELRKETTDFASKVWAPSPSTPGMSTADGYLSHFGYRDNPAYIQKDTALADLMNVAVRSGKDLPFKNMTVFSGNSVIFKHDNLRRWSDREFGPNNALSNMFSTIRDREAGIKVAKDQYAKVINSIGIKGGTEESALLMDFAEKKLLPTSDEFLALPEKLRQKLINGNEILRKQVYDPLFKEMNEMLAANNFPQITAREDYVTHFKEAQEQLPDLIKGWMINSPTIENRAGQAMTNLRKAKLAKDPIKTYMPYELPRTGGEYTRDAIGAMEKYLDPSLKRIFLTDMVRNVEAARDFSGGALTEVLGLVKDKFLLDSPTEMSRRLADKDALGTLKFFQRAAAEGEILFKFNSLVNQVTSTALNFLAGGERDFFSAVGRMNSSESKRLWAQSKNRVLRDVFEGVDTNLGKFKGVLSDLGKLPGASSIKAGREYWKKMGGAAIGFFDEAAAKHGFLTAYNRGIREGLTEPQAIKMADMWVDKIHNSLAGVDQPMIRTESLFRALTQFQTFSINLAATLMNDLPNMAFHDGAAKVTAGILRTVAATSIVNEGFRESGLPAPFDLQTFIPFAGSFKFGAPGYFDAAKQFYTAANEEGFGKTAGKKLLRKAAGAVIPGAGQMTNFITGANAISDGKVKKGMEGRALLFGPGMLKAGAREKKEYRKSTLFQTNQKIKKKLFE